MVSVLKSFLIPVRWLAPAYRMVRQLAGVRPDLRETIYQLEHFGYQSILIVIAAGCAVGGIVAVHASTYVTNYSAGELAGWAVGYATLREVGPLLTGLLLAGRVGAMNAAELADMKVRDQIRGLEALGLDPVPIVVAPRLRRSDCRDRVVQRRRDRFIDHGGARRHDHHRAQARPLPLLASRRGEPLVSLYRSSQGWPLCSDRRAAEHL